MFNLQVLQPQELTPSRAFPFYKQVQEEKMELPTEGEDLKIQRFLQRELLKVMKHPKQSKEAAVHLGEPSAQATLTKSGKTFMRPP